MPSFYKCSLSPHGAQAAVQAGRLRWRRTPHCHKAPVPKGGGRSRENQTSRRNCVRKKINGMGEATLDRKGYTGLSFEDDRGTGTRGNKGECPTAGKQFSRWVQETQRAGRLGRGRRGCGGWQWPRSERPRQEVCISLSSTDSWEEAPRDPSSGLECN